MAQCEPPMVEDPITQNRFLIKPLTRNEWLDAIRYPSMFPIFVFPALAKDDLQMDTFVSMVKMDLPGAMFTRAAPGIMDGYHGEPNVIIDATWVNAGEVFDYESLVYVMSVVNKRIKSASGLVQFFVLFGDGVDAFKCSKEMREYLRQAFILLCLPY